MYRVYSAAMNPILLIKLKPLLVRSPLKWMAIYSQEKKLTTGLVSNFQESVGVSVTTMQTQIDFYELNCPPKTQTTFVNFMQL